MFDKKEEDNEGSKKPAKSGASNIAKKDFVIAFNGEHIVIKKGDVVKVPDKFLPNLKTEGVI
jgi:hypothetical protein